MFLISWNSSVPFPFHENLTALICLVLAVHIEKRITRCIIRRFYSDWYVSSTITTTIHDGINRYKVYADSYVHISAFLSYISALSFITDDFTSMFTNHTFWGRQTPYILSQCRQSLELSKTSMSL